MIVTIWPFQSSRRMSVYTVHEPPNPALDRIDRAEAMVFLKDAFNWSAFVFAPLWLLANRLWLGLAGYVAVSAAVLTGAAALELEPGWVSLALVALHAVVAYEAHALQVAALEQRGWNMIGSVMGASEAECERRFFEGWLPTQQLVRPVSAPVAEPVHAASTPEPPRERRFAFWRR